MTQDGAPDELTWELVSSEAGPDLAIFRGRFDTYLHPVTGKPKRATVLEGRHWCNIVALTSDGSVVLIRQFRFGSGEVCLEIPGGLVDAGEEHGDAAARELREETGYSSSRWTYLGDVYQNPAFQDNICHMWLAEGAEQTHTPSQEPGEHIAIEVMSADAVRQAVRDGVIRHAHVIVSLSRVLDLRTR